MQVKTLFPASTAARLTAGALVIALAGAFATFAQAQPMGGAGGRHGHEMAGPMAGAMGGRMIERMLDSVNASAEQRTKIREIMKAAGDDLRKQREGSRGLRDQMMALFAQPAVDARAVESLRQQMLQQHDQSSRRMTQAMLDASAVLTPEQRTQLAERMKQRRELMERHHNERRALEQK